MGCQSPCSPVAVMSGTTTTPSMRSRISSERFSNGIQRKWPCSSPWAKTSCMSDRRDAVPRRSSALTGSPWIATNSSRPLGRTTSIAHTRNPVRAAASPARACMSARARASPQLRSRVLRSPVRTCSMASRPPTATWIVGGRWWAPDRFPQVVACAVDELVPGRRRVSAPRGGPPTGSHTVNVVPSPSTDATSTVPSWPVTTRSMIARPRPVPGRLRASGLLERKKGVNTLSTSAAEMPMPVSVQVISTPSTPSTVRCATSIATRPPSGVYFTPLDSRLETIRCSPADSPVTTRSSATTVCISTPALAPMGARKSLVSRTRSERSTSTIGAPRSGSLTEARVIRSATMSSMRRAARSSASSELPDSSECVSRPSISRWENSTLTGLRSSWARVRTMSRR